MTVAFLLTVLVSILALLVYVWTFVLAGRARDRFNVKAPSTEGPEEFRRAFRVQQNTVEQIVLFLPALWLTYGVFPAIWPALFGLLWPLGRALYTVSYTADPAKRGPGFLISVIASVGLLLAALVGAVLRLLQG